MWVRVCLAVLAIVFSAAASAERPKIAIIIDDIGYRFEPDRRAVALPGPLAYAVLPGAPRARTLARVVHEEGKEVLLHLPLQAANSYGAAEPDEIGLHMDREQLSRTFREAIETVPFAIGVNNHRGSLLTQHLDRMRWLMEEIRRRDSLFFIDSYTTYKSVALDVAKEAGINARKRDVFLDPDKSPATVARQFERMKRLARLRGSVIAIGHPHAATLDLLEKELPKLAEEGFDLVPISELVRNLAL